MKNIYEQNFVCLRPVRPLCSISLFQIRKNPKSNEGGGKKTFKKKNV